MQGLPGDLSRSLIGNRLAFLGRGYYAPQLPAVLGAVEAIFVEEVLTQRR